jgi:hypothetical protein
LLTSRPIGKLGKLRSFDFPLSPLDHNKSVLLLGSSSLEAAAYRQSFPCLAAGRCVAVFPTKQQPAPTITNGILLSLSNRSDLRQASSRKTRLASEKYNANITKRGNVPVGVAAVC